MIRKDIYVGKKCKREGKKRRGGVCMKNHFISRMQRLENDVCVWEKKDMCMIRK